MYISTVGVGFEGDNAIYALIMSKMEIFERTLVM